MVVVFKYGFNMWGHGGRFDEYVTYDSNSFRFEYNGVHNIPASEYVNTFIYNDVGNTNICAHRCGVIDYIYFLDEFGKDD